MRTAFSDLSDRRDFIIAVNQSNFNAYNNNMELNRKYVRYHMQNVDTDSSKVSVTYDFEDMANDELFVNQGSKQAYTWANIFRIYKGYLSSVNTVKDSIQIELKKYKE